MRHFAYLDEADLDRLFLHAPAAFGRDASPDLLAVALGATLYSPATRPALARDVLRGARHGVVSTVVCLEDAVPDRDLAAAERNLIEQMRQVAVSGAEPPLVFVRVRTPDQIPMILDRLAGDAAVLTGFVLPKFGEDNGSAYLDAIADAATTTGHRLFAMPVLESADVAHADTRLEALLGIRRLLDKHRERVLAVRIGATDLASAYGLRRGRDLTVYDVQLLAAVIADVVNVFGRLDEAGTEYAVTGAVWEYFTATERLFKPQLRESPFVEHDERRLRARLIADDLDGLIREVTLDRANGLTGKTVIHPSHVAAVNALSVVTHEEYLDARDVADTSAQGGVAASAYRNKMNESKPHTAWARRTLLRARAFGVAREDVSFVDLLAAALQADE
jgi:citrate lyase beta subunit